LRGLKHKTFTIEVLFATLHQIFFQYLHEKWRGGWHGAVRAGYLNKKVALLAALARLAVKM